MIEFKDVTKKFGSEPVLDKISFLIPKGSFVYLVGPTGSGKTTIFRLIIRDVLPNEGSITLGEWDIAVLPKSKLSNLRRRVAVVFQDLKLLTDRTVVENVMLPLLFSGSSEKDAKSKAEEILIDVGLSDKGDKFPAQLSGGERQRVAIARALVFDPEVILADEPTGNLDTQTSFQILDLLKSINSRGTTIFMATHNDKLIEKSDERVIVLEKGRIIEDRKAKREAGDKKKEEKENKTEKNEKEDHRAEKKDEKKDIEEKSASKHEEHSDKIKLEALAEGEKDA